MTLMRGFLPLLLTLSFSAVLPGLAPCCAAPLTVLHTFGAGGLDNLTPADHKNADRAQSEAPLLQGRDGALYGTAPSGGLHGTGVIFRIGTNGTGFAVLHSFGPLDALFTSAPNADGAWPTGALIQAGTGALYGTTTFGGSGGSGVVFMLNPDGTGFKFIHAFGPKGDRYDNNGGAGPVGLTLASDGFLYGAARFGGKEGKGLVFKLNQDGKGFQIMHVFRGVAYENNANAGGALPGTVPVVGGDSALYGTTNIGGTYGYGVLYRMTADGKQFAILHQFQRQGSGFEANGVFPEGPLTVSADGFLYGSTRQGGAGDSGVLFKMGQDGNNFTVLHTFSQVGDEGDGGWLPGAAPLLGSDGRLYGTAGVGGANGTGTLFWASVDSSKFVVLHDFSLEDAAHHNADGSSPGAKLIQGRDGALYGVTSNGGRSGNGTLFRLVPPQAK